MPRKILLGFALLATAACATPGKSAVADERPGQGAGTGGKSGESHPVFVGHGSDGELVMASTHYDSMNGLAVGSQQLGVTSGRDEGGDFVCKRETVTGTHMPQWICRYKKEVEEDRRSTQRMLDSLPKACMDRVCNQ
jgi:hypothetical protein